jgi:hypothetical protein
MSPGLEIYQYFKGELTSLLLKLFYKMEKEGMLPNSFNDTSIILIIKQNKDTTTKKKE